MQRRIAGFHQDEEQHWVAELECGHSQHIRHDPPWQMREWVLRADTRSQHLGTLLNCVLCDALDPPGSVPDPYVDARIQGLCPDGAAEAARQLALRRRKPE